MPRPSDVGVGVALVAVNDDGKVLMLHRTGAHGSGTWSFPGGWIDRTDASMEETAVREILEEMGVEVSLSNVYHLGVSTENFPDFRTVTIYYWTRKFKGDPKILEPHKATEWAWVDPENPPSPLFGSVPKMWPMILGLARSSDRFQHAKQEKILRCLARSGHSVINLEEAIAAGLTFSVQKEQPDGSRRPVKTSLSFEQAFFCWERAMGENDDLNINIWIVPDSLD